MPNRYLENRWDKKIAATLSEPELLRYRSNLLGSDLRITNYGGGNTSAKVMEPDPLDGKSTEVFWVKGSGGDLGTMAMGGFAALYLDKFYDLIGIYRGVEHEDDMVPYFHSARLVRILSPHRSILLCTRSFQPTCRPLASGLGDRAGGRSQWRTAYAGIQPPLKSPTGFLGNGRASNLG